MLRALGITTLVLSFALALSPQVASARDRDDNHYDRDDRARDNHERRERDERRDGDRREGVRYRSDRYGYYGPDGCWHRY